MPRTPINTDEKIIETGEALSKKLGRETTATDIHKALGGKGKYARIREIWEDHLATRETEQHEDISLPDDVRDQIDKAASIFDESMQNMVRGLISRMTDQTARQFALKERDFAMLEAEHATKVKALEEEVAYLTECLDQLEAENEVTDAEAPDDAPEQPSASEPAPAAAALAAARKSPNRPLRKTRPAPRKAARAKAPAPKKSPAPTSKPS